MDTNAAIVTAKGLSINDGPLQTAEIPFLIEEHVLSVEGVTFVICKLTSSIAEIFLSVGDINSLVRGISLLIGKVSVPMSEISLLINKESSSIDGLSSSIGERSLRVGKMTSQAGPSPCSAVSLPFFFWKISHLRMIATLWLSGARLLRTWLTWQNELA